MMTRERARATRRRTWRAIPSHRPPKQVERRAGDDDEMGRKHPLVEHGMNDCAHWIAVEPGPDGQHRLAQHVCNATAAHHAVGRSDDAVAQPAQCDRIYVNIATAAVRYGDTGRTRSRGRAAYLAIRSGIFPRRLSSLSRGPLQATSAPQTITSRKSQDRRRTECRCFGAARGNTRRLASADGCSQ